jgi:FSR family fosmidomycin resistance protein-like MFS transporter
VERRIMILTCTAHFFTHLFMLVYPTIAVVQARAWNVPVADLLVLAFPGFLLYGLAAVPFGLWADRAGGGLPVTVGLLGMGVGAVLCTLSQLPWHLAVGLSVIGLFASAYHPAGLGLITHGVRRSAWALGVNGSFGSGAVAVAPGLAELVSEGFGWRFAFGALAVPALIVGVVFLFLPIVVNRAEPAAAAARKEPTTLWSPTFLMLCVTMLVAGLAYRATSVALPVLFDEHVGFVGHGVATSMAYSLAIIMNYAGGRLTERFDAPRVYWAFHALSLPPLIAAAWMTGLPLLVLMALYTACALGTQPAENSLLARLTPVGRRSVGFGVKFTLAFGVGALAVPVVAAILKYSGTQAVQWLLVGLVTVLLVLVTTLTAITRRTVSISGGSDSAHPPT